MSKVQRPRSSSSGQLHLHSVFQLYCYFVYPRRKLSHYCYYIYQIFYNFYSSNRTVRKYQFWHFFSCRRCTLCSLDVAVFPSSISFRFFALRHLETEHPKAFNDHFYDHEWWVEITVDQTGQCSFELKCECCTVWQKGCRKLSLLISALRTMHSIQYDSLTVHFCVSRSDLMQCRMIKIICLSYLAEI